MSGVQTAGAGGSRASHRGPVASPRRRHGRRRLGPNAGRRRSEPLGPDGTAPGVDRRQAPATRPRGTGAAARRRRRRRRAVSRAAVVVGPARPRRASREVAAAVRAFQVSRPAGALGRRRQHTGQSESKPTLAASSGKGPCTLPVFAAVFTGAQSTRAMFTHREHGQCLWILVAMSK